MIQYVTAASTTFNIITPILTMIIMTGDDYHNYYIYYKDYSYYDDQDSTIMIPLLTPSLTTTTNMKIYCDYFDDYNDYDACDYHIYSHTFI